MALGSSNTYFLKDAFKLKSNWLHLEKDLEIWGYSKKQVQLFKNAYDYFILNPTEYDGATMSQDLYDVPGLELAAMKHDYTYIFLKAKYSAKAMRIADFEMYRDMKKMSKCGVQITWRRIRLSIVRRLYAVYNQLKNKYV